LSVEPKVAPAAFSKTRVVVDLTIDRRRNLAFFLVVDVADGRGNGESGRHRQTSIGHLGEAGAFAAEEILHVAIAVGFTVAEKIHMPGRLRPRRAALRFPGDAGFFGHRYPDSVDHERVEAPGPRTGGRRAAIVERFC